MRQSRTAIAFCLSKTFRPHETTSHFELEALHATEFLDTSVIVISLVEALLGRQKPCGGQLDFWSVTMPGRIGYVALRSELALTGELCCPCHFAENVWRYGYTRRHQIDRATICCYSTWCVAVGQRHIAGRLPEGRRLLRRRGLGQLRIGTAGFLVALGLTQGTSTPDGFLNA